MTQQPALSATISGDGVQKFNCNAYVGQLVIMEIGGSTFGGGTATFGYMTEAGAFAGEKDAAHANITATASRKITMFVPASGLVAVSMSGSTSPNLTATVTPCLTATRVRIK